MTNFSDGVWVGRAGLNLGISPNNLLSNNSQPPQGRGVLMSPQYVYTVVPLTLQTNNIALTQTPGGAGNLTLTAGTGTTAGTMQGKTVVILDVPRCIKATCAADDSAHTYTVSGFDIYGQPMSEAITGPVTNRTGKKAFYAVWQIAVSAAAAGAITIGTSDTFGVPYAFTDKGLLMVVKWNNTLADDASTVVVADATSPATTTTGDTRGTVTPSAGASDGAKRLVVNMAILNPDTTTVLCGVTQV